MERGGVLKLAVLVSLGFLAACTKEIPKDEVSKLEVTGKSLIDSKADYIYSASMAKASLTSADAFPYFFGQTKRVKLRFTKDALVVEEQESDKRFQDNETNNKTVLEIPVEHIDYKCSTDRYGECTNKEVVNDDIDWSQKGNFKFKPENLKEGQFEILPILMERDLSMGFCYNEISSRIVGAPEVTAEAVNFEVERTFKQNIFCNNGRELSDTNIKARFFYSMVKADKLVSQDFKTAYYNTLDEDSFGFFNTERYPRDTDNSETQSGKISVMNHWNPNRTSIDFHLSDEFNKPENEVIKKLTFQTIANMNKGLKEAGAKFQINLHNPSGKIPGDIRNSMIVLVEDPTNSGVIGYGPQTEDPVTGEIVSARTVMYLGTIKSGIKRTYDELVRAKKRQQGQEGEIKIAEKSIAALAIKAKESLKKMSLPMSEEELQSQPSASAKIAQHKLSQQALQKLEKNLKKATFLKDRSLQHLMQEAREEVGYSPQNIAVQELTAGILAGVVDNPTTGFEANTRGLSSAQMEALERKYVYHRYVKNCAYGPNFNLGSASHNPALLEQLPGDLKPWEELSESEKNQVINLLLPEVWVATLIHEMGHNLGLRHNFQGSQDKDNFYKDEDLVKFFNKEGSSEADPSLTGDNRRGTALPVSSSVMEYIEDLIALKNLGKYDIAALRMAYGGKVEITKAKNEDDENPAVELVDVQGTLAETLKAEEAKPENKGLVLKIKEYGYCTDEHTGINSGCRRFDVGTTLTEIVKNSIETYKEWYSYRNFRRDRVDFSSFNDVGYAARVGQIFYDMRLMMEVLERVANIPQIKDGGGYDHEIWQDPTFWGKDLRDAAVLGGKFMLEVLTTPELTCVVAGPDGSIAGLAPLKQLGRGEGVTDCFQVNSKSILNPAFKVVAQAGKSLNSIKDSDSPNRYFDQIDVRGYWLDKLQALRYLLYKQVGVGSLDKFGDTFTDLSELRPQILETLQKMITNNLQTDMDFNFADGSIVKVKLAQDTFENYTINKVVHPAVARRLGVPNGDMTFTDYLAKFTPYALVNHNSKKDSERATAESFQVEVRKKTSPVDLTDTLNIVIGDERFIVNENNTVAIPLVKNALELQKQIRTVKSVLEHWKAEDVAKILKVMATPGILEKPEELIKALNEALGKELTEDEKKLLLAFSDLDPGAIKEIASKKEVDLLNNTEAVKILRLLPTSH